MSMHTEKCVPNDAARLLVESITSVYPETVVCEFYTRSPLMYLYTCRGIAPEVFAATYDVIHHGPHKNQILAMVEADTHDFVRYVYRTSFWYPQLWRTLSELPQVDKRNSLKFADIGIVQLTEKPYPASTPPTIVLHSTHECPVHVDTSVLHAPPNSLVEIAPGWVTSSKELH